MRELTICQKRGEHQWSKSPTEAPVCGVCGEAQPNRVFAIASDKGLMRKRAERAEKERDRLREFVLALANQSGDPLIMLGPIMVASKARRLLEELRGE